MGKESLMVWGMALSNGFIHLERLEGRINNVILDDIYGKKDYFLQQDNALIHICKAAMAWFREHEIKLLDWPSRSPDLNLSFHIQFIYKKNLWTVRCCVE